jgi:4-amino-4-deoxy-L-arabinose transferase-like glycosyltransferase
VKSVKSVAFFVFFCKMKRAVQTIAQRAFEFIIILLAISAGSLFFRLGSLPLSGADEPRYARIAEEMHIRGAWVTPTLEGKPWLEKPPLYYWVTIPMLSIFDGSETAARFGPAVCTVVTALAVFWLGTVLWSKLAGGAPQQFC